VSYFPAKNCGYGSRCGDKGKIRYCKKTENPVSERGIDLMIKNLSYPLRTGSFFTLESTLILPYFLTSKTYFLHTPYKISFVIPFDYDIFRKVEEPA